MTSPSRRLLARHTLALSALGALAPFAISNAAQAQAGGDIAQRVSAVTDGDVHLTYASRAEACGDGRNVVGMGSSVRVGASSNNDGRWYGTPCVRGPAHVEITVRDRQIVAIRTRIGGPWPASASAVELGTVSAPVAAAYFLSLAPRNDADSRVDPLLAAAVADSVNVVPDMLRIARTASISRETRRRAVHWTGALGDASAVAPLVEIARADGETPRSNPDDVGPGDRLQSAAVGALSMLRDDAGLPALMDLGRRGTTAVRKAALFWLGQRDESAPRAFVRAVAADAREDEVLRGTAIFALGQGSTPTAADRAFLRDLFGKLSSERLQDRVLMSLAQSENTDDIRWMLAQARSASVPMEVRRKAVFWAGQGHASLADLTSLYHQVQESRLREHVIFVMSQRDDERAVQALLDIARSDDDHQMRKKALFWLAQKDDPRVTRLIAELVAR